VIRRLFCLLIAALYLHSAEAQIVQFSGSGAAGPIIPTSRIAPWQPGVTYNGGIPNRTNICQTLTANGTDDTTQINSAISTCCSSATSGSPQVVLLNANLFKVSGNGIIFPLGCSYTTLRGSGLPAAMATGGNLANDTASALNYVSGTWIIKSDRNTNHNFGIVHMGRVPNWTAVAPGLSGGNGTSTNLTADGTKGNTTVTVASTTGLSVGQVVLIDHVSDNDPNVFYGNRNDLSGYFTGSLSGTSLTFTAAQNGPSAVNGSANVSFSGTSMSINSAPLTGYAQQLNIGGVQAVGVTVFDTLNNYYGYITAGTYPGPFTMSQSNSGTNVNINLGGVIPQVGYPIFDSTFSTAYGFITGGTFPNFTMGQSNPTLTGVTLTAGGGSRRFFSRQDRSVSQLMKITNITGSTITFETPFYYTFQVALGAQLSKFDPSNYPTSVATSVESLGLFGGEGGDGEGNMPIGLCASCWVKGVESYWSIGTGIGLYGCYRCEVRDSFSHETPSPNPGGGGYLSGMNTWTSDSLFENNIMWQGNKEVVIRNGGGGNVVAYNYMDDAFGGTYPESPEAGVNAAHNTTSIFALLEGNYSQNFEGDAFWGNSPFITTHRNWLSGIRSASPSGMCPNITPCTNLRAYVASGSPAFPYGDYLGRRMVDVQGNSYQNNFTGNVLGFSGESLLNVSISGFSCTQTTWVYEELDSVISNCPNVIIYNIGTQQNPGNGFQWVSNTYTTQLRSGNWDWNSQSQQWHGIGGSNEYGGNLSPPFPSVPNSYYLPGGATASIPSFFSGSSYGTTTWPWVNPANGFTSGGAITSGTYNSSTGAVSLTVPSGLATTVGASVIATGLLGTGTNLAALNGIYTTTSGTSGTTINFTAATGQGTITITGGMIQIPGGLPAMRRFLSNTPNTL
jgi:hypothetical protein